MVEIAETYNERFKIREKTFNILISRNSTINFVFIQSLSIVFTYFWTAILPINQFNVNYFLKHLWKVIVL